MEPQKPKVAFFMLRSPEEKGQITGGTWSTITLLSGLVRHEPLVLLNARDIVAEELEKRGVRTVVIPSDISWRGVGRSLRGFAMRTGAAVAFNQKVRKVCTAERARILQCDENAALFVAPGAKLAGAKVVIVYRNYPSVVPKMKPFYKVPMLFADRLVTPGELLREVVTTQGIHNPAPGTALIYNGIDMSVVRSALQSSDRAALRRKLGIAEGEVAVGVIGSIVAFKHQTELLQDVVAPFAGDLRAAKVKLYFLGGVKNEDYLAQCHAIIAQHRLEDLTVFKGYVNDIPSWLIALDMLAYPAPEGPARALFEGAAFGLPAVARSTSREMITDGVTGFLRREIKDFAEPILRLARSQSLRSEMGAGAKKHAEERFDAQKNREQYEAVYDELLSAR